jgi:hypothetical protein
MLHHLNEVESAGVTQVQNTHRHTVVHQNCLDVTRVSAPIASISFVIFVPLVFEFRDELSAMLRLADALYALRTVASSRRRICRGGRVHGSPFRLPGFPREIGRRGILPEQRQQWAHSNG